ncbi:protein toll [Harmonia axyridis]|uniref:protein toll n=1 Tax=Harmonia axyridis TaxID=115357 RepID=UPI001E277BB0|nr:protein toll [Harmonia axyridis]XP_045460520.1 protein toll [Harmonia axyridis]
MFCRYSKGQWIISLILILSLTKTYSSNDLCKRTGNCHCLNNSDHYEYQCFDFKNNEEIILHIYPNSSIQIDCNNVISLNSQKLPQVVFKNIDKLKINYCPLPDNGLREIVDHFGLQNLDVLSFEYGIFDNFTLPKEKVQGINNVTVLKLRANDLNSLEDGFFENFPELVSLELDRNHLELKENSFSALSKLKFLSISDNHLEKLPSKIFQNLNNLEKLNVWKNDLKVIERHTFEGLHNLKVLELAFNKIEEIEEGALDFTPSLVNISFRYNSLKTLSRSAFKSNNLLEQVIVSGNSGLHLENGVFADLTFLNSVDLEGSKLDIIPEDLFENCTSLAHISLGNNNIELIPKNLFKNLINLKTLSLANNKIKSLDDNTFKSLTKLETLFIQGNELKEMNAELLKSLTKLKELDLSYNKIRNIHLDAFGRNKLRKIYLQHNLYRYERMGIYPISPFNKCGDLEEIDLSYNEVIDFPEDLMLLVSVKSVNISHNNISSLRVNALWKISPNDLTIDLESNQISYLKFDHVEITAYKQPDLDAYHNTDSPSTIRISRNPIVCDCFSIDFVKYLRNELYPGVKASIYFVYDELVCESPEVFKGISVENITPDMLSCPIEDVVGDFNCTNVEECGCIWRPFDYALVINCQGKNLTSLPEIMHPSELYFKQTEVHMENNLLMNGPTADDIGFWNVSRLFLGNNSIKSIGWVPPRLEILDLHNNRIENIDYAILDLMNKTSLKKIFLRGNPWICDCSAANLTSFLRQHVHQIDTNHIYCVGTSNQLINLNEKDLCPTNPLLLASAVVLILCLCVLSSMAAIYYRFQREIKVWMYAHNICLFLIEEEELDKDKIYDAFVSYSHKDEDFVIENLISILEGGPKPYKLCLHFRNWVPGEFIAKQVTSSVHDSRRTLVVLSPNFLESVWGKMEFRTAHTEAMREGRARVIIVLYGDVNMDSLDDELKAYMKTNTYIKWGDPWFWDKLKYALPHSRIKGFNNKSQKHANMMKYIEDKFVLVDDRSASKTDESDGTLSLSRENVKKIDEENVILRNEIA